MIRKKKGEKAQLKVVRSWNRGLVLEKIREAKSISRYDIAKATGLNPSTVTKLTLDLIEGGYVEETGQGQSSGGRKPLMLRILPDHHHFFVHQLLADSFTFSILDFHFKRVRSSSVPFEKPLTPEEYEKLLRAEISRCSDYQFIGSAVGVVGTVNPTTHDVTYTPGISGVCNPAQILGEALSPTAITQNLTRVQALYECSRLKNVDDLALVILDHGIGLGLVLDGKPRRGRSGLAGEIGHTWIGETDCTCLLGHRGCLESHAGIGALLHGLKKIVGTPVSIADVDRLVMENQDARRLIEDKIDLLAGVLAAAIDSIEPEVLVFAGSLVGESTFFYEQLQKRLRKVSFCLRDGALDRINLCGWMTNGQKENQLAVMLYEEIVNLGEVKKDIRFTVGQAV